MRAQLGLRIKGETHYKAFFNILFGIFGGKNYSEFSQMCQIILVIFRTALEIFFRKA